MKAFEELRIWKEAQDVALAIYKLLKEILDLISQEQPELGFKLYLTSASQANSINCNKEKVDPNNLLFKYDSLEELINSRHNVITPRISVPPASKSKHIKY